MTNRLLILILLVFSSHLSKAQCFQVLDGNGVLSNNPYFISCAPGNFTVFIQTNQALGPYTISWGDGSPNSTGASLVPPALVSHTYTATTDTFLITITEPGTACTITGVVVLERNPLASIQLPTGDDNFGCTPVQFRFVNSSTQVSQTTVFTWDFGDGSPIETYNYLNAGDTVLHTYLPGIGVQSCDLTVNLTATNYCGTSTATFFPLKVWDLDEAVITPSATLLCYPDTIVQYTNNTIRNCFPEGNQSQRYEKWNFGDYWGLGRDSIIDWRPWNPPITPPPPIGYPGVGTYVATLIDSSFCGLDTTTVAITITNPPTSIIAADRDTICSGESITFTNNSIGGANAFQWNFDQGAGFQNLNGAPKTRTFNTAGDYTVQLVVGIAGANGCNDTSEVDIHVIPRPTAAFNFDNNNECDTTTVNFTDNSVGTVVNWFWDFDNGSTFTGQNPPSQFFATSGVYNVKLVVTNPEGCQDSIIRAVTVRETPQAGFSVASVCLNLPANFIDQSISTLDPIVSYKWYFGDGDSSTAQDPVHIYSMAGMFTVTQIVDNGFCLDTITQSFTVETPPDPAFLPDTSEGCSPLAVNFTNFSSANAIEFRWIFGDGSAVDTTRDPSHLFVNNTPNDTSFIVSLITRTSFGCVDTSFDTITVYPIPIPSFTSDAVLDCGPLIVNFTNTTLGDSLNYFWDFGDSTPIVTTRNPTHIFENRTLFINNYNVKLNIVSNNGCTAVDSQIVTVYPEPIFTFSALPDTGCSPLSVTFPSVVGAVDYQWDFGDGSFASGPTPTHVFINNTTNNQTFRVTLVARNSFNCFDTTFTDVLVYPNPAASFVVDTNIGCHPLPIQFTNTSTGAVSYDWRFGDGTISDTNVAIFTKTYLNSSSFFPTDYYTQLIAISADGCSDTLIDTITVNPQITAQFSSIDSGCSPLQVNFRDMSRGASVYEWTFGDGGASPAQDPIHIFFNQNLTDTIFNTQLKVTSPYGCSDSINTPITVYPLPIADFIVDVNDGCQPLDVTFTDQSSIADSCSWDFGDNTLVNQCSNLLLHTYTNTASLVPISYQARLEVFTDKGCSRDFTRPINVRPQVISDFSIDADSCSPVQATFRSQSFGAISYLWDYGDGTSGNGMLTSHTYVNQTAVDDTFQVRLIARSLYQCDDTLFRDILVRPTPLPDFTVTPFQQKFPAATVALDNTTNAGNWTYEWDFDDSTFSNLIEPGSHTYDTWGDYFITMTASSPFCEDSITKLVKILVPDPIADFNDSASGCEPLEVQFQSTSQYAQSYRWDFGDGSISNAENPIHTYFEDGDYTVTLEVGGFAPGLTDTEVKTSYIRVFKSPRAGFFTNKDKIFIPNDPLVLINTSFDADNYLWDFGDGNTSTEESPTHFYKQEGEFSILLTASSVNGCVDTFRLPSNVIAELQGNIRTPNAFTPNPNGSNGGRIEQGSRANLNDVFYPVIIGSVKYELNIFNKWGELLFVSKDINIGWDGYYRGELCQQDVYVWKVKAEFVDGETVVKVGDVLLLR